MEEVGDPVTVEVVTGNLEGAACSFRGDDVPVPGRAYLILASPPDGPRAVADPGRVIGIRLPLPHMSVESQGMVAGVATGLENAEPNLVTRLGSENGGLGVGAAGDGIGKGIGEVNRADRGRRRVRWVAEPQPERLCPVVERLHAGVFRILLADDGRHGRAVAEP